MADILVETTNLRGVVEQKRVSANETMLSLGNLSLIRIDGPLERATTLQKLYVQSNTDFTVKARRGPTLRFRPKSGR
jgi:hypothetical protein